MILQFMMKFQCSDWDHSDYEFICHLILALANVQHVITNALLAAGVQKKRSGRTSLGGGYKVKIYTQDFKTKPDTGLHCVQCKYGWLLACELWPPELAAFLLLHKFMNSKSLDFCKRERERKTKRKRRKRLMHKRCGYN